MAAQNQQSGMSGGQRIPPTTGLSLAGNFILSAVLFGSPADDHLSGIAYVNNTASDIDPASARVILHGSAWASTSVTFTATACPYPNSALPSPALQVATTAYTIQQPSHWWLTTDARLSATTASSTAAVVVLSTSTSLVSRAGEPGSLAFDPVSGHSFVASTFTGSGSLTVGGAATAITASGAQQAALMRVDSTGHILWVSTSFTTATAGGHRPERGGDGDSGAVSAGRSPRVSSWRSAAGLKAVT
jgi:hypothetical protein